MNDRDKEETRLPIDALKAENERLKQLVIEYRQTIVQKDLIINGVMNSKSYKIGLMLTAPLRRLLGPLPLLTKKDGEKEAYFQKKKNEYIPNHFDIGIQALNGVYGIHRSGWSWVVSSLQKYSRAEGIYLDTFIEKTFCWHDKGASPIPIPWVGIIHNPYTMPAWFYPTQTNQAMFRSSAFKKSLPNCRGLFTLSEHHARHLRKIFSFPVNSLLHPTPESTSCWSMDRYVCNPEKKIVQIGWWLRNLNAINELPETENQKCLLIPNHDPIIDKIIKKERSFRTTSGKRGALIKNNVTRLAYMNNFAYDRLLEENLVFLNLYDSSANNTVIECIARGTPLIINRLKPIEEYLGQDYPLFYDNLEHAAELSQNHSALQKAHEHLIQPSIHKKISMDTFVRSLLQADVFQGE